MRKAVARLADDFMQLLFPPQCAVCRARLAFRRKEKLCPQCCEAIGYLRPPVCRVCGMELTGYDDREYLCGECLCTPPDFSFARSLVRYEPVVQQLIQRLKYVGDTSVAAGISTIIRGQKLLEFADCDWIIPVPLHVKRHRKRGFNQATFLAGLFFPEQRQLIRADWLIRVHDTTPQTRLGGLARRKNLRGAFAVRPEHQVAGAMVCLVDDVYTTGTTVGECAKVLVSHGARGVKVLTLARVAVPQRGRIR